MIRMLKEFGPGLVTGAADDDPSGIATYTIAGAQFGHRLLWTAWLTWPLMAAVQMTCAQISLATRQSLTEGLLKKFPRGVVLALILALLAANILNVAADLAAMSDAIELLTGRSSFLFVLLLGAAMTLAMIFLTYAAIARTLTWLTFFLLAYVLTALKTRPDPAVLWTNTVTMNVPGSKAEWATLVAILGTTISPYLFFWQSSQEIEEIRRKPRFNFAVLRFARRWDVLLGTLVSNLVMYFVILTAAGSLHEAGVTEIETSAQAARALEPLLGSAAALFYTGGLLGVGLLAIPTLVGSATFALADFFRWPSGLSKTWRQAKTFYVVLGLCMLAAIALDAIDFNPIKGLFYSSVVNGLLSPVLIVACYLVARDPAVMKNRPIKGLAKTLNLLAAAVMAFAALGLFAFS